jgi:hypothetical protein
MSAHDEVQIVNRPNCLGSYNSRTTYSYITSRQKVATRSLAVLVSIYFAFPCTFSEGFELPKSQQTYRRHSNCISGWLSKCRLIVHGPKITRKRRKLF